MFVSSTSTSFIKSLSPKSHAKLCSLCPVKLWRINTQGLWVQHRWTRRCWRFCTMVAPAEAHQKCDSHGEISKAFLKCQRRCKTKASFVHIRRSERVKSTCFPHALTIWDFFGPKIRGLPETVLWSMRTAVSRLIIVSVRELCWVQGKVNVMLCFIPWTDVQWF